MHSIDLHIDNVLKSFQIDPWMFLTSDQIGPLTYFHILILTNLSYDHR